MDPVTKKYNICFFASVCHICKQSYSDIGVKKCFGCRLIVYCSIEHQREHWPDHKNICIAIQYVYANYREELSAYKGTSYYMKFLLQKVSQKLNRPLKQYESQMFLYARRMCQVCYTINSEVECCPRCMTVWLCVQHTNNHDRSTCDFLKLCFESEVSLLQEQPLPYLTDAYMRVTSYEKNFSNMKEFINIYGDIKGIRSETPPHLLEIKQSMRLTKPLTVLYGMRVLNYNPMYKKNKTEFVLHITDADISELETLREWEILLHTFPTLLHLNLVLIGPSYEFMEKRTVCDSCVQNKKSFSVEWHNISYEHYIHSCSTFKKPEFVVRFHINDECNEKIKKTSVDLVTKHNCFLLLCYPCEKNMSDEIIITALGNIIGCRAYKNPFASLHPERQSNGYYNYVTEYENNFLTIYRSMYP